ncbi:unnamed protein product, partial [Hapterophycus canaliculatus]
LTRVLAGDPLEGKVFDRGNALETASLVMDTLLDLSGCSTGRIGEATGGASRAATSSSEHDGGGGGALGEQRRYADVASDLARSRVFTSVLLDTGRLASFLREAVAVLEAAAADVSGRLSIDAVGGPVGRGADGEGGEAHLSPLFAGRGKSQQQQQRARRATRPEPLLRSLCSFCLEHSPARSTFIRALLDGGNGGRSKGGDDKGTLPARAAARHGGGNGAGAADPCAALFALCLHPHPPSAAAASTLLQCLLVGGGALGA